MLLRGAFQMMLKTTKGLTWPFLVLALATSLVFMAGLAALQVGFSSHPCYPVIKAEWGSLRMLHCCCMGVLLPGPASSKLLDASYGTAQCYVTSCHG